MDEIEITLCAGTACAVMDGSRLLLLEEQLPERLKGRVRIRGERCLELCHTLGAGDGPYVLVAGEPLANASLERIRARVEQLCAAGV